MTGRPIELHEPLPVTAQVAVEATMRVLKSMGDGASGQPQSLNVFLHDLHVALVGEVAVPIVVAVEEHPERWESALTVRAASDEGFFPTFTGTLSVSPNGRRCELWLIGEYHPPFGSIGAALDATVLRHAARRSLQALLSRIAADVLEDARETEREHERDIREMHS
jgi:hypothetical protein